MQKNTTPQKNTNAKSNNGKGKKITTAKTKGIEHSFMYLQKNKSKLDMLNRNLLSTTECIDAIDNTTLSAKVKSALKKILEITETVGGKIYAIGRIAISILIKITKAVLKKYPQTAFGVALGCVFGAMLVFIPFIGPFIAPYAVVILALIGGIKGFFEDVFTNERIAAFNEFIKLNYA